MSARQAVEPDAAGRPRPGTEPSPNVALRCGVVVPSYRRPEGLRACLEALARQSHPPDEIIVVARADDEDNHEVVAGYEHLRATISLVLVDRPGVVAALEAGVHRATTDIVALTDDDARPHPDWLARLSEYFQADSRIAGVGGRDRLGPPGGLPQPGKRRVGKLGWFGRVVGNHHVGVGPPREVDVLKGVNCAYRRDVLLEAGFDHRLRGAGAQLHWELALGLAVIRSGRRLIYDPSILVDHDEGPRMGDQRLGSPDVECQFIANAAYNQALILLEHLTGFRRLVYLAWAFLIGMKDSPGLLQALRFTPKLGLRSWHRWIAAERARQEARRSLTPRGSSI